ncbi:MAG TPA: 2,3-bisphosphoglycerate-dependent phosphoglycerate mutase [Actinomycetales bacterium]|nr:2,3-bisphosphoglycerate-dependent phosphoglycerate mutase [Actinomycetales bacterium]
MLILVRHGESVWNASDRFAGCADVGLTEAGRGEARSCGRWLREQGIIPTRAHASMLARASDSAHLILDACGASSVPLLRTGRLNERHYGLLQGMRRADAVERFGPERVASWRRGIDSRPPADRQGRGESLADVRLRLRPYLQRQLIPALAAGHRVLVVSHGNALRMLVQLVQGLSDEEACALQVPTGAPRLYENLTDCLRAG